MNNNDKNTDKKILIVDDEESLRNMVSDVLDSKGFNVAAAATSDEALEKVQEELPDLILLDLGIPDIGGLEVCRIIRRTDGIKNIPIIILTARDAQVDKIIGLEAGADDYITKPFHNKELIARIKAVLRRTEVMVKGNNIIKFKGIVVDPESYKVTVDGKDVELRPKEFKLLRILIEKRGRVLSRDFLCKAILGYDYFGSSRAIDAHVKNLRKALGKNRKLIKTIRGFGYKIEEDK